VFTIPPFHLLHPILLFIANPPLLLFNLITFFILNAFLLVLYHPHTPASPISVVFVVMTLVLVPMTFSNVATPVSDSVIILGHFNQDTS